MGGTGSGSTIRHMQSMDEELELLFSFSINPFKQFCICALNGVHLEVKSKCLSAIKCKCYCDHTHCIPTTSHFCNSL